MWIPLSPKGELRFDAVFISESLLNKKIFIMMSAILLLFSFCCTVYPEQSEGHTCAASIFSVIKNLSLTYGAFQKVEVIVCFGLTSTNILFLLSYRQASQIRRLREFGKLTSPQDLRYFEANRKIFGYLDSFIG